MLLADENIVQNKPCKKCGASFDITDKDIEFYEKMSPIFHGEKYNIPSPTLCPDCRNQRRLTFRNERRLYKRKCDATGKDIISIYNPDQPNIVYNQDLWFSDSWDIMDYYKDIDFEKSFFEQFKELNILTPKRALIKGTGSHKCDFCSLLGASNNCYLVFDSNNCDDCFFGNCNIYSKDCYDCSYIKKCELGYMLSDCTNCYKCFYLEKSLNCANSRYLYNCSNCSDCFGCVNLNNKKYCIFNKQYSQSDYQSKLKKILETKYNKNDFDIFKLPFPNIHLNIISSDNVSGDNISNSSNIQDSYEIYDSTDIKNGYFVHSNSGDCRDVNVILNNSFQIYDTALMNKDCVNILFCSDGWAGCSNLIYCTECKNTKDCFLSTGLLSKQYCILNKQYTKEEYNQLVPKIIQKMIEIGEWGEFFPGHVSGFGYNETVANLYYPLERNQAIDHNFNWSDYEAPFPKVDKVIPASKLPANISDIPDDILNWAIECEITKRPFIIIKEELEFYRKYNLPIPRRHPDQRYLDRMALRNPRKLFKKDCDTCGIEMDTTYPPDREEIVYCEGCYNKEIY